MVRVLDIIIRAEKWIYIVLVILAGASWKLGSIWALFYALMFVVIRIIGKVVGGFTSTKLFDTDYIVPSIMGLGLLSQGGIAIAIVINFQQVFYQGTIDLILTIVIIAAVLNELISPVLVLRLVKGK